ncbi:pyridoxal phosphate-dependent transferase [Aspergillus alliaceus]|uniref:pyridoxal phosphate-dependent transferase n=1 Tax=Petromyces alliaceus TaxID=209559 RepID=UPI0012A59BD4|nr:pyridoxal phosphate-dependent transferase [Aspergillus alliaceus]KAB8236413.1 pyridoxal phosphate-dependent transferase [Aspergillus alliaceus]
MSLSHMKMYEGKTAFPKHATPQAGDGDQFTGSVYGSRFGIAPLPSVDIPDGPMPSGIAYRMVKDKLSLDNNPKLNLASFVSTYMEEEAEKLMTEAMSKNFIDFEEYPETAEINNYCANMIGSLFHAPKDTSIGTSTVGSSEAIMLAVLAMKRRWKLRRQAEGKSADRPNIIMSSAVQVCWEKAASYFDIEERYVNCTRKRFVIDPEQAVALCDENTIGIVAILGTTYTGAYEDVKAISDILEKQGSEVPIHVDAASGGFVAPFINPDLEWDFRIKRVVSINVSGHKYGLVYPGVGWVVWRSSEYLPQDLIFNINYLGAEQSSFTLNFSKGAAQVIGQYYQLIRLGKSGFRDIMYNLVQIADYLTQALREIGFIIMSETGGRGLPLVAFRFPNRDEGALEDRDFDEFALAHYIKIRGWVIPAYTMAPDTDKMKMMRIVVREDFSRSRCDLLIKDIKLCCQHLEKDSQQFIKRLEDHAVDHAVAKANYAQQERHSLQGKTGKTHAVC